MSVKLIKPLERAGDFLSTVSQFEFMIPVAGAARWRQLIAPRPDTELYFLEAQCGTKCWGQFVKIPTEQPSINSQRHNPPIRVLPLLE